MSHINHLHPGDPRHHCVLQGEHLQQDRQADPPGGEVQHCGRRERLRGHGAGPPGLCGEVLHRGGQLGPGRQQHAHLLYKVTATAYTKTPQFVHNEAGSCSNHLKYPYNAQFIMA